jgi:hypothetical protein
MAETQALKKLKPCPWCGKRPKRVVCRGGPAITIGCENPKCAIEPMAHGDDMEHAVSMWNDRSAK